MNLYFKKIDFINDEGLFTEQNVLNQSFLFEKMESDFTTDNSDSLFEVQIFSSRETQIMVRRYERVLKVLANLGGISYFMVFLEYLIVMAVREYCLMRYLVNYLYSFPLKASRKKNNKHDDNQNQIDTPIPTTTIMNNLNFFRPSTRNYLNSMEVLQKNSTLQQLPTEIFFSIPRESNFICPKKINDETPDMNSVEK